MYVEDVLSLWRIIILKEALCCPNSSWSWSGIFYFYVTNTWGRVGLGFRKKMSLNLMSLIGVGRVGLRPNSDNVTNYTLFFFEVFPYHLILKQNYGQGINKGPSRVFHSRDIR